MQPELTSKIFSFKKAGKIHGWSFVDKNGEVVSTPGGCWLDEYTNSLGALAELRSYESTGDVYPGRYPEIQGEIERSGLKRVYHASVLFGK